MKCFFRVGRLRDAPGFLESLDVEESQSCQSLRNRARRQLVLLEQLGLIFTKSIPHEALSKLLLILWQVAKSCSILRTKASKPLALRVKGAM